MRFRFVTLLATLALIGTLFCGAAQAAKGTVNLVYVEWSTEVASTNVVRAVLQERMGYDCEITPVSAAAMWQAVATDEDVDGMVSAWLPITQRHYLEKLEDKVDNLGPNLEGARIGLVVPSYVEIDSLEEMNKVSDKFRGRIVGIDPGSGVVDKTEKAIKAYNLSDIDLVTSSGAMMTATLADSIKHNEWVAVTGWTPHWMFAKWDLKYLKDPKGVYGDEEFIGTFARKGLDKDMPEVYSFLDNFYWSPDDMAEVMVWIQDGMKPYEAAKKWINENKETVDGWING
ncbi:glycine betaine ABC transporter substrate-binding protein [Desulfobaculum sp. SPO524]|uniref:glycine betaine ABC transporter substrate-binding protein n=1 Tax=Desulfobaculum sp. SPO524 TaxID=3378071 RepID=UPI0038530B3B